ncbi:alpha/beta hydrolase [Modestobacter sp. NPDC049651]|uniref:alpha/beta fold hydrolase n=1 Tax=unclassified Modestobacter TaxID=2643866 RepID=UPI0034012149
MADLVLVHGAWHGAWCWQRVLPGLTAAGHRVHPVTLSGLGERAHQPAAGITLATHVADVVTAVRAQEFTDVVLVGHSYAGMVVTGAADQLDEVARLVYVDGVVPHPGQTWAETNPPAAQAERRAQIAATGVMAPPPASAFGLSGADAAWVDRRQTSQPGGVYDDPLHFDGDRWAARPRTYVDCSSPALPSIEPSRVRARTEPGWEVVVLDTGHDPMVSAPAALTAVLLDVAAR